jgi:signal transduction histidine kinase
MSNSAGQSGGWLTQIAMGRHLSYRAVRARLTLLYGGLFVLSGAALMLIAYLLLVNAGFIFSLQSGPDASPSLSGQAPAPGGAARTPLAGETTHPSAQTLAYWGAVARCMRQHGVAGFPMPADQVPSSLSSVGELSDRDGAILVFPHGLNTESATFGRAAGVCGFSADSAQQLNHQNGRRAHERDELILQSGIALALMSLLSLGLGWFIAGRVLQPLEAAHAAQRQFVANAAHELRTPLTRQRALIQVALADPSADATSLRAAHERALAAEQQLEQLINGLLTLTRGQAGLERLETVDLAVVASDVVSAYEAEVELHGLSVQTRLSAAPAQGDSRLTERLVANLIANAIRHNRAGGEVEIETGTYDRSPFVSVANSGSVIDLNDVERLFRPFERMGAARTAHDGGHGLGLSIVRAIADAHGAKLSVSPRPQGGLVVEVVFPTARAGPRMRLSGVWLRRAAPRATLGD